MLDYYEILNVSKSATFDEIKKSYKKLVLKYHPDKNKNSKDIFLKIKEAYEILSNPEKRKNYDISLNNKNDFTFFKNNFFDNDFVKNSFDLSNNDLKKEIKGKNIIYNLGISLKDIYNGKTITLNIKRKAHCGYCSGIGSASYVSCHVCNGKGFIKNNNYIEKCKECSSSGLIEKEKCEHCNGSGFNYETLSLPVTIPKGINNNDKIIIKGKGHCGIKGNPYGDLIIKIIELKDKKFKRDKLDLIHFLDVSHLDLILGSSFIIKNLNDEEITLNIPPLTQPNTVFRIKNKGFTNNDNSLTGNFIIKLNIILPNYISDEAKSLYEKIKNIESFSLK